MAFGLHMGRIWGGGDRAGYTTECSWLALREDAWVVITPPPSWQCGVVCRMASQYISMIMAYSAQESCVGLAIPLNKSYSACVLLPAAAA